MPGLITGLLPLTLLVAMLVGGTAPRTLSAHEGPPFPLFMDKPLGELRVSLWADPDIGDARFFIVLESSSGTMPEAIPQVTIWTQPVSGRLARVVYPAKKQSLTNRMQFEAQPYFDQQDHWEIGVSVTPADGKQQELLTEVESTPPGLGPWDLAIYLFPFVLLGGLWGIAMVRRRRALPRQAASQATVTGPIGGATNRGHSLESQSATGGRA